MKEFPRKFLSLRDKNGTHHRSRSNPPGANKVARPLSAETFKSIFKIDHPKPVSHNEVEEAKDATKIDEILQRLEKINITDVSPDHIRTILATMYADGDPERTVDFIDMEHKAAAGLITSYDPGVQLVGAENRSAVTCYIDSLLFAMFAKLDAFECMLKNDFAREDPKHKLVNLLRIYINMLRRGKLIRTDMTKLLQDALADCGWQDARMLEQQDTSEAFAFLTETLQLPLLSLQVDLFHQGRKDDDDHKVVYERLLNLAVPPDPEGKGVKLEDCLEEYFNAQVDVLRDSEVAKKSISEARDLDVLTPLSRPQTLRLPKGDDGVAMSTITASPIEMTTSITIPEYSAPETPPVTSQSSSITPRATQAAATQSSEGTEEITPTTSQHVAVVRTRSASVIQRVVLDEKGRPSSPVDTVMRQRARRKGSTIVKAVTIPAWQFFRLIPWHSASRQEPRSNSEVATNFDQRPVVGICLKRYAMTDSGAPIRLNTFIDIPDSLRLPHFMLAEGSNLEEDTHGLDTEYKMVLQSIVCHRGDSLQSGHYIAFSRVAPKLLTDNRRYELDPPPDYEEAQWVKFDDLQVDGRVTCVDDIRESLKVEMPYLLFYQVVPMVDVNCPSTEGTEAEPPSYNDSKTSLDLPRKPGTSDGLPMNHVHEAEPFYEAGTSPDKHLAVQSKPPSIRLSAEVDRPPKGFFGSFPFGFDSGISRRQSVNFSENVTPANITPAITPDGHSPVISPVDESTASRLSRAASRFNLGRQSRPVSQSGDNRISTTMARLGIMKPNKESNADPNALSHSATISVAELTQYSLPNKQAPESPTEPKEASHLLHHGHKHKHKRGKSKEKVDKHKAGAGEQPERECLVM